MDSASSKEDVGLQIYMENTVNAVCTEFAD